MIVDGHGKTSGAELLAIKLYKRREVDAGLQPANRVGAIIFISVRIFFPSPSESKRKWLNSSNDLKPALLCQPAYVNTVATRHTLISLKKYNRFDYKASVNSLIARQGIWG